MADNDTQRIFIAAPVEESVKQFLHEQIAPYKDTKWGKQIRWGTLENLHLTLRFLGDTEKATIDEIIQELPFALEGINQIEVGLSAPRPFPSVARPRVIAALIHPNKLLDELAQRINDCIASITKTKRGKHFRGHITVGRCRRATPPPAGLLRNDTTTTLKIGKVIVYKSELLAAGAQHTPLLTVELTS